MQIDVLCTISVFQTLYARPISKQGSVQETSFVRWSTFDLPSHWKEIDSSSPNQAFHWQKRSQELETPFKELALFKAALEWFRQGDYFKASRLFERLPSTPFQEIHLFFWVYLFILVRMLLFVSCGSLL